MKLKEFLIYFDVYCRKQDEICIIYGMRLPIKSCMSSIKIFTRNQKWYWSCPGDDVIYEFNTQQACIYNILDTFSLIFPQIGFPEYEMITEDNWVIGVIIKSEKGDRCSVYYGLENNLQMEISTSVNKSAIDQFWEKVKEDKEMREKIEEYKNQSKVF